jgi:heme-degrading monooxygenase HmoA
MWRDFTGAILAEHSKARNGVRVMTHIAINRFAVLSGNDDRVQEAARALFDSRRPLLGGDLCSLQLVRSTDGDEYALISVWASAEADARYENDAVEQQAATRVGPIVVGAPSVFAGTLVAEV